MTPLGTRVFIKPEIQEKAGSFHLVRMSRQMPDRGVITAISPKAAELTGCKAGDRVIYDKHHQQLQDGEDWTITYADKILAILK